jgi:hypothetical protein
VEPTFGDAFMVDLQARRHRRPGGGVLLASHQVWWSCTRVLLPLLHAQPRDSNRAGDVRTLLRDAAPLELLLCSVPRACATPPPSPPTHPPPSGAVVTQCDTAPAAAAGAPTGPGATLVVASHTLQWRRVLAGYALPLL